MLQFAGQAQVNITNTQSAIALAEKLTGQGVTVLNPVLSCDYFAAGIFKTTSSNLGLDSGILLTTGIAADASGFAGNLASTRLNAAGDPQLASLAHATTYDACRLEFDVIPKDDSLRFEYVFGSEEYNNATCGPYNDAFSFFISGPGITGQDNMALVPGTLIPVAVNSINNGNLGPQGNISNCTSMGPGAPFTGYYVDNSTGTSVTYKGFTKVLRATHAVQPCATYHLKLTIADAGNGLYDSGVFLKAGSLRTATYNISAVSSTGVAPPVIAPGCSNARVTIKRSDKKPVAQSIRYLIGGNAINGSDYAAITDSVVIAAGDSTTAFSLNPGTARINGPKTVKLYLLDPYSCGQQRRIIDSTVVTLFDAAAVAITSSDTTICAGDAVSLHTQSTTGLVYNWSPAAVVGGNSATPVVKPTVATTYVVSATLPGSGCPAATDSVRVDVMQGPKAIAGPDTQICNGTSLDLIASASPAASYSYSWLAPDGSIVNNSLLHLQNAAQADSGLYILQVLGTSNICYGRDTVAITVKPLPAAPAVISPFELCVNGQSGPLRAEGVSLRWFTDSLGETGSALAPVPLLDKAAEYQYFVSAMVEGCESKRAQIDVSVLRCCGSELALPDGITPNGDGRNDYFSIIRGAEGVGVDLRIFNRWGQQVFRGGAADRWDGTQAGEPAPAGAYFYQISLDCRNGSRMLKKGELTLIR